MKVGENPILPGDKRLDCRRLQGLSLVSVIMRAIASAHKEASVCNCPLGLVLGKTVFEGSFEGSGTSGSRN